MVAIDTETWARLSVSTFTLGELADLNRPCIYIFIKGEEVVYVGKSKNGLMRFGSKQHHVKDFDRALIFWFRDEWSLLSAERVAIARLRPRFNAGVHHGGSRSTGHDELDQFMDTVLRIPESLVRKVYVERTA